MNYFNEVMMKDVVNALATQFDLLLGRSTYENFTSHLPYVTETNNELLMRFAL